jgi:hypothetical protein
MRTCIEKAVASCWTIWVSSVGQTLLSSLNRTFVVAVTGSWEPEELAALSKDTVIKLHARYVSELES